MTTITKAPLPVLDINGFQKRYVQGFDSKTEYQEALDMVFNNGDFMEAVIAHHGLNVEHGQSPTPTDFVIKEYNNFIYDGVYFDPDGNVFTTSAEKAFDLFSRLGFMLSNKDRNHFTIPNINYGINSPVTETKVQKLAKILAYVFGLCFPKVYDLSELIDQAGLELHTLRSDLHLFAFEFQSLDFEMEEVKTYILNSFFHKPFNSEVALNKVEFRFSDLQKAKPTVLVRALKLITLAKELKNKNFNVSRSCLANNVYFDGNSNWQFKTPSEIFFNTQEENFKQTLKESVDLIITFIDKMKYLLPLIVGWDKEPIVNPEALKSARMYLGLDTQPAALVPEHPGVGITNLVLQPEGSLAPKKKATQRKTPVKTAKAKAIQTK